jgi:hypothetical protein
VVGRGWWRSDIFYRATPGTSLVLDTSVAVT